MNTTIAKTSIVCEHAGKIATKHLVELLGDGSVRCACSEAPARAELLTGEFMLGKTTGAPKLGCVALAALTLNADSLLEQVVGAVQPNLGPWKAMFEKYRHNPVFKAAIERAEEARADRSEIKSALMAAIEKSYKTGLGKKDFRAQFMALWDVPVGDMHDLSVCAFSGDRWAVPYMPGWKERIADEGLAVIDGKVVCGRSGDAFYAIVKYPAGDGYIVRKHVRDGNKLVEVARAD